jgi:peptidoglycan/LPS O-acetylase OafA/YrhL
VSAAIPLSVPGGSSNVQAAGYLRGLDGLRALAVLAVIIFHTRSTFSVSPLREMASVGWAGVDLFFVLSGFLISRILQQAGSPHYLKTFYARRTLRIWPLYFSVLLFAFISYQLFHPGERDAPSWWAYALFVQNFAVPDFGYYPLQPTWSLAIEEQFYIVWPLLILKMPRRTLAAFLLIMFASLPWIRHLTMLITDDPFRVYVYTFCRLDGLVIGSLIALYISSATFERRRLLMASIGCSVLGALGALKTIGLQDGSLQGEPLLFTSLALMFGGVLGIVLATQHVAHGFLESSLLRCIGRISFGLYLLQFPAFAVVEKIFSKLGVSTTTWSVAATFFKYVVLGSLALASWHFLEKPCLSLKDWLRNHLLRRSAP